VSVALANFGNVSKFETNQQIAGEALRLKDRHGGEGGIRTHDTVARMPHFECGAFDHSATSPLKT
jgi:hypothetical protein